jgi:NAD(P)H-dependent flavin oxidoreductase YrpB (nitropropane dioxygenase family)
MALVTRNTELTGCRVPVQQAPMGSVSTAALAVAVAAAGGVGSITMLGLSPAQVDKVLGGMASRTSGVLAANFLTGGIDPEAVLAAGGIGDARAFAAALAAGADGVRAGTRFVAAAESGAPAVQAGGDGRGG